MSYIIGSFNLRDFNFGNKSTDDVEEELKRDFKRIAKIIIKEGFDVVALQEINAPQPLKHLTDILNNSKSVSREYSFVFGEDMPNKSQNKDAERYGFIWNNKRLRLLNVKRNNNPGYYQSAGAIGLIRPPYYARFTARGMLGGSNFELRLVNTHIKNDRQEKGKLDEFNVLVRQVLPRICDHQEVSEDGEIMPAYTFLLGDYNLSLNKTEQAIYKIDTISSTSYTGRRRDYLTVQRNATTLRVPNDQKTIEACYANDYDHFTYDIDLERKLILTPQRVTALEKYISESREPSEILKIYRKKVSDHVPIKLIVDLK